MYGQVLLSSPSNPAAIVASPFPGLPREVRNALIKANEIVAFLTSGTHPLFATSERFVQNSFAALSKILSKSWVVGDIACPRLLVIPMGRAMANRFVQSHGSENYIFSYLIPSRSSGTCHYGTGCTRYATLAAPSKHSLPPRTVNRIQFLQQQEYAPSYEWNTVKPSISLGAPCIHFHLRLSKARLIYMLACIGIMN